MHKNMSYYIQIIIKIEFIDKKNQRMLLHGNLSNLFIINLIPIIHPLTKDF
jgi:hypothetical protein